VDESCIINWKEFGMKLPLLILRYWGIQRNSWKSSFFWDITPCSLLIVSECLGGSRRLNFNGRRIIQERNQSETSSKQSWNLGLFFDTEDGGDMFVRKIVLTFHGLHSLISKTIEFFITTSVRTSNPTYHNPVYLPRFWPRTSRIRTYSITAVWTRLVHVTL
jgi:hypothetical protein